MLTLQIYKWLHDKLTKANVNGTFNGDQSSSFAAIPLIAEVDIDVALKEDRWLRQRLTVGSR